MGILVGISGASCAGKSVLTRHISESLRRENFTVHIINQDDYYKLPEEVEPIPSLNHWDYELPSAVKFEQLIDDVENVRNDSKDDEVIILEGILIFTVPKLLNLFDLRYFLTIEYEECKRRRLLRTDYIPPDVPGYFDQYVWPAYVVQCAEIPTLEKPVAFLDSENSKRNVQLVTMDIRKLCGEDWVCLQHELLEVDLAASFVKSPCCGAISVFMGTTRDTFENKTVVKLEYEAYESMAVKTMKKLCADIRCKWSQVKRICIFHRLGEVPVEEASVVIAVSAPHRAEAQAASQFAIDELKRTVPIWKKEIYANGNSSWKENTESVVAHKSQQH